MLRLNAFFSRSSHRLHPRLRQRPYLEALESRTLPASVFVVPLASPPDSSHFHSLQDAVEAAGSGGTVVVQAGTGLSAAVIRADQAAVTMDLIYADHDARQQVTLRRTDDQWKIEQWTDPHRLRPDILYGTPVNQ